MVVVIKEEISKIVNKYPLSYREVYVLNSYVESERLEEVLDRICRLGLSVEEYLIKILYLPPMKVHNLLYEKCTYYTQEELEKDNKRWEESVNGIAAIMANAGDKNKK